MFPEQREALDEIVTKIRAGRITRRTFLERAAAVGLSSTAAVSLLEACGSTPTGGTGGTVNLVWQSENDATTTYQDLTNTFNNTIGKQKGIHVTWNQGPSQSQDMMTKYNSVLRARSHSIDILSIDIIYPAQFAAAQWLAPITDSQFPTSQRSQYLPGPIQGCTYQGKLWAAPFRTDIGILYYRKDLVSTPPSTYDDLTNTAKGVSPSKVKYGYVWQGSQYEGLVCDFVEVLYGYGGSVLDPNDPTKVTINSPQAQQALTEMVSWVGTISPTAITTYTEEPARITWQNGDAAFMRNWPYAVATSGDSKQSKVAGKFDVAPLPHGPGSSTGHSCIGGWNLGINAFTPYADQAWEFIKFMLSPASQKQAAIQATFTVTLQSVYDDAAVLSKEPLFGKLKPMLQTSLPRPVSPRYSDVSDVLQRHVYAALKKQATPADALSAIANELTPLVSKS